MMATVKSEFRKLLSVRTTYVLGVLGLLLTIFFAGYVQGFKLKGSDLANPDHISSTITDTLTSVPMIFASIVAILLVTHEYRYNTILYTLASSRSRLKVLFSKLIVISVYAAAVTAVLAVLAPLVSLAGIHLNGGHLAPQHIDYTSLTWRVLFYGWSSVVSALIIALIVRSQVGAIVTLFVIPTAEIIFTPLLQAKAVYLPFTGASNAILVHAKTSNGSLSYGNAALVFGAYLLIGWIIACVLFLKRDAN
jgi:ABC-2 type transport system permease protein